ncbi:MAG: hypothetical protein ABI277_09005 [Burkholderiaceae bacterium]
MASPLHAVCCAIAALAFWTLLGLPTTRRLLAPSLALPFAPLTGWALHSVVALPVFFVVPFSTVAIVAVASIALVVAWLVGRSDRGTSTADDGTRVSGWAWTGALALATLCAAAILPKHVGDAVILSDQIFDHAKVSIIDDMVRLGVPPGNPFLAHDGSSGRLAYYYLLHFSAAEWSRVLGVTGWEADIAMTFFAAFTSLAAMMGLAVKLAGRSAASVWVVVLAASSSARILLLWLFGPALDGWLAPPDGLGGWLFQSSWVPQHLIATSCVLLAVVLMEGLSARVTTLQVVVLGAVMAAAFESSTWVGGIVLACVAAVVVPLLILRTDPAHRLRRIAALSIAGVVTLLLVWPLLADQLAASALRHAGSPVAIRAFDVLGNAVPESFHAVFGPVAYWLVLLPVAMPAVYLPGLFVLFRSVVGDGLSRPIAWVGAASLACSWLLVSTLADNNDLGWRAALLASTTLIVFAAVGLATWIAERRRIAILLSFALIAAGLPEAVLQIERNLSGQVRPGGRDFARAPDLWANVRAHTRIVERIASNPYALMKITPWPINAGWSLLADRRSCYAGWELTQVFTSIPHDRLRAIDAQFDRVFNGDPLPDDVKQLAVDFDCAVAVVTPQDPAWNRDPFMSSPQYRLVDEVADRWRIYRRREAGSTGDIR